jgi:hypothetical protein
MDNREKYALAGMLTATGLAIAGGIAYFSRGNPEMPHKEPAQINKQENQSDTDYESSEINNSRKLAPNNNNQSLEDITEEDAWKTSQDELLEKLKKDFKPYLNNTDYYNTKEHFRKSFKKVAEDRASDFWILYDRLHKSTNPEDIEKIRYLQNTYGNEVNALMRAKETDLTLDQLALQETGSPQGEITFENGRRRYESVEKIADGLWGPNIYEDDDSRLTDLQKRTRNSWKKSILLKHGFTDVVLSKLPPEKIDPYLDIIKAHMSINGVTQPNSFYNGIKSLQADILQRDLYNEGYNKGKIKEGTIEADKADNFLMGYENRTDKLNSILRGIPSASRTDKETQKIIINYLRQNNPLIGLAKELKN